MGTCPRCGEEYVAVVEDWEVGMRVTVAENGYCEEEDVGVKGPPRKVYIHAKDE